MRIGLDGFAVPTGTLDPFETLDFVQEEGLEGYFFGSLLALSSTLDLQHLGELRSRADELGLYLEVGIGNANPARFAQFPAVVALGEGDYRRGLERQMEVARRLAFVELRIDLGGEASRFNQHVPWSEQLTATRSFLLELAPLCRDLGCRLDLETHGDITTFELIRLIEDVGADVLGVCLDTANVLCRAEDPVAAARRVAPYVHQTHAKDAILYFVDDGLMRQSRPCGQGCIDWQQLLSVLAEHSPDLTLSVEDHKGLFGVRIYDPSWQALHPELTVSELASLVRLAHEFEERVGRGETPPPAAYETIPWADNAMARLHDSVQHLRAILQKQNLEV
jgi:sugar phosphate isomerase/epimerase